MRIIEEDDKKKVTRVAINRVSFIERKNVKIRRRKKEISAFK